MAKNSITDYDNIAANNADVQSVDISEGCSPSGINNAIREVMADLADVNDGTVALTSPSVASLTLTGNASFGDSDKAQFGAGNDLQIYHDATNSKIENTSGDLYINSKSGEAGARFQPDGAVSLFYDNSAKIVTSSTGVDVNGNVTVDSEGGSATVDLRQGSTKAWANYKGTSTNSVRDSFNTTSVTDNGSGDYTQNITNSFSSADNSYAVSCQASDSSDNGMYLFLQTFATGSFRFGARTARTTSKADVPYIFPSINGDLA